MIKTVRITVCQKCDHVISAVSRGGGARVPRLCGGQVPHSDRGGPGVPHRQPRRRPHPRPRPGSLRRPRPGVRRGPRAQAGLPPGARRGEEHREQEYRNSHIQASSISMNSQSLRIKI